MLTIKRRFPWRRLYFYGSGALIVGFAGIMTFLVQTNTNLDKFVSVVPAQTEPTQVTQVSGDTSSENAQTTTENSEVTSSAGTRTTWNGVTMPSSSSTTTQPNNSNEKPAETTPAQPTTPTEPTVPTTPTEPTTPVEPEPEDPTIIDEVIDIITVEP